SAEGTSRRIDAAGRVYRGHATAHLRAGWWLSSWLIRVIIYTYLFAVLQEVSMTKVAIVTASDSGIGKTTALMLAERGFDIGVTWHSDEQGARDTCREVEAQGRRAEAIHLDLSTLPQGAQE